MKVPKRVCVADGSHPLGAVVSRATRLTHSRLYPAVCLARHTTGTASSVAPSAPHGTCTTTLSDCGDSLVISSSLQHTANNQHCQGNNGVNHHPREEASMAENSAQAGQNPSSDSNTSLHAITVTSSSPSNHHQDIKHHAVEMKHMNGAATEYPGSHDTMLRSPLQLVPDTPSTSGRGGSMKASHNSHLHAGKSHASPTSQNLAHAGPLRSATPPRHRQPQPSNGRISGPARNQSNSHVNPSPWMPQQQPNSQSTTSLTPLPPQSSQGTLSPSSSSASSLWNWPDLSSSASSQFLPQQHRGQHQNMGLFTQEEDEAYDDHYESGEGQIHGRGGRGGHQGGQYPEQLLEDARRAPASGGKDAWSGARGPRRLIASAVSVAAEEDHEYSSLGKTNSDLNSWHAQATGSAWTQATGPAWSHPGGHVNLGTQAETNGYKNLEIPDGSMTSSLSSLQMSHDSSSQSNNTDSKASDYGQRWLLDSDSDSATPSTTSQRRSRSNRRFKFTVSRTSEVDILKKPGSLQQQRPQISSPPQQQQQQQQLQFLPQQHLDKSSSDGMYLDQDSVVNGRMRLQLGVRVSLHPLPLPVFKSKASTGKGQLIDSAATFRPQQPILYIHSSIDSGASWWSQPLVPCKGKGQHQQGSEERVLSAVLSLPKSMWKRQRRCRPLALGMKDEEKNRLSAYAAESCESSTVVSPSTSDSVEFSAVQIFVSEHRTITAPPHGLSLCTLHEPGSYWLEFDKTLNHNHKHGISKTSIYNSSEVIGNRCGPLSLSTLQPSTASPHRGQEDDSHTSESNCHVGESQVKPQRDENKLRSISVTSLQLIPRPLLLVTELTLLAGRRGHLKDDQAAAAFRHTWVRSQRLQSLLLVCSTCRSFESFQQTVKDKQHVLQEPDVLLLSGGTEIMYRTPRGWSVDEIWQDTLAAPQAGWRRRHVGRAVQKLLKQYGAPREATRQQATSDSVVGLHHDCSDRQQATSDSVVNLHHDCSDRQDSGLNCTGSGMEQGKGSTESGQKYSGTHSTEGLLQPTRQQPPPRIRVKMDADKHQGPFRLRLLVSGGGKAAREPAVELVLQRLEHFLQEEAKQVDTAWGRYRHQYQQQHPKEQQGIVQQQQQWQRHQSQGQYVEDIQQQQPRSRNSNMLWRCIVHHHVEGGGAAHMGWSAIDLVPFCAGPSQALKHVTHRFGIRPSLVTGCIEISSDQGQARSTCQEHEELIRQCGAGAVLVGYMSKHEGRHHQKRSQDCLQSTSDNTELSEAKDLYSDHPPSTPVRSKHFGPHSLLQGLRELGLFVEP